MVESRWVKRNAVAGGPTINATTRIDPTALNAPTAVKLTMVISA